MGFSSFLWKVFGRENELKRFEKKQPFSHRNEKKEKMIQLEQDERTLFENVKTI